LNAVGASTPDPNKNRVDGYSLVHQKYVNKEWDILRVHEFVKTYVSKLEQR
jgi:hypothetical protein